MEAVAGKAKLLGIDSPPAFFSAPNPERTDNEHPTR
jgi:hypothetical protein